ncbi:RNA-recognition motif (RRM) Nup35-type domain-containing protein [Artemisia annua]|uniref:RNA-recognition motif (RRM) Nup35-type domain-containing protein n=1 Tax=Artemisia annua TaxID=35608 RepID=A0A2U1NW53_ARTAN|nr:RNA-recognition motif (RRM) Nup35-type domain-containing protein [Artemisia annua]
MSAPSSVAVLSHVTELLLPYVIESLLLTILSQEDAEKALNINGMQVNNALIIGLKLVNTRQWHALKDELPTVHTQVFMPLRLPKSTLSSELMTYITSDHLYQL